MADALYETDFYAWTMEQAARLHARRRAALKTEKGFPAECLCWEEGILTLAASEKTCEK